VQVEGKNVQLLGDPMLNNCGPAGSPANSATVMGVMQQSGYKPIPTDAKVAGKHKCEKKAAGCNKYYTTTAAEKSAAACTPTRKRRRTAST
jgi:hypothetical protein